MSDVDRVAAFIAYGGSVRGALEYVPGWDSKNPSRALEWLVEHEAGVTEAVKRYDRALRAVQGDASRALLDRLVGLAVHNLGTASVSLVGKGVPVGASEDSDAGDKLLAGLRAMAENG